jgi:putative flippase GtrA
LDNPLVATAIGVGVGLIFNFTLSKRFVFRAS